MLDTGFDDADDVDGRVSLNSTLNTLEFRVHGPCLSYCVFTMRMKEQVLRCQMKGKKSNQAENFSFKNLLEGMYV